MRVEWMKRSISLCLPALLLSGCIASGGEDDAPDLEPVAATEGALTRSSHTTLLSPNNIYSPQLLWQGGQLQMYFGGWASTGQTHDAIYRATCSNPYPCSSFVKVLDSTPNGFNHLNDPTIVRHPGGYYIMYMTGVLEGQDGFVTTNNKIYYSTSWADDGVNWSKPQLLLDGYWVPSVTIRDGRIYLYANSTTNGTVRRFDLGTSGASVLSSALVTLPPGRAYSNVDVMYRPSLGLYQILAENLAVTGSSTRIDYLYSYDGLTWSAHVDAVVVPAPGQLQVRTPAPHPDTHAWVYFGETSNPTVLDNAIKFATWAP